MGTNYSHIGIGVIYFLKKIVKTGLNTKKISDMVLLARILFSWENIVGLETAKNIYPFRVINNKLKLICKDSQWLQILVYIKPQILENIKNKIKGGKRITEIVGTIGEVPRQMSNKEVEFPSWQDQQISNIPELENKDLLNKIVTCRKKLQARLIGLLNNGYVLCSKCESNLVYLGNNFRSSVIGNEFSGYFHINKDSSRGSSAELICSICINENRRDVRLKLKDIIYDFPWLNYELIAKRYNYITQEDYEEVKQKILEDLRNKIKRLLKIYERNYCYSVLRKISFNIQKLILLENQINLEYVQSELTTYIEKMNFFENKVRNTIYANTHWR